MATRFLLSDFLEEHPQFDFDLLEHVEASQVIDMARAAYDQFFQSSWRPTTTETTWKNRRDEIRSAVDGIRAYSEIDWERENYQDFLPFIDKWDLRTAPEHYLSPQFNTAKLWSRETSGTSGPPIKLLYAPSFFAGFQYFSACKLITYAGLLEQSLLDRPVFCMMVLDNRYLRNRVWLDPSEYTGMTLRIVFDEADAAAPDRLLDLIIDHRPAVLSLGPHILAVMLARLGERCRVLDDHIGAIISGGSHLTEELRRSVERVTCTPIIDAYGMTEIGEIASECGEHQGLHLHETTIIAEVLQNDGLLEQTGCGELVVSSIMNRAMPLLRYRTGDRVDITDAPCSCGRPGRRITSLLGRNVQPFHLSDGSFFSPTHLNPLFRRFDLREFQITQKSPSNIEVKVEFSEGSEGHQEALREIHAEVSRAVNAPVEIDVREYTFAPNSKFQRYRSLIAPHTTG